MIGQQVAYFAMPPFPGAQYSSVTSGDSLSFMTMACSLPPPPTTNTFMLMIPFGFCRFLRSIAGTAECLCIRKHFRSQLQNFAVMDFFQGGLIQKRTHDAAV